MQSVLSRTGTLRLRLCNLQLLHLEAAVPAVETEAAVALLMSPRCRSPNELLGLKYSRSKLSNYRSTLWNVTLRIWLGTRRSLVLRVLVRVSSGWLR